MTHLSQVGPIPLWIKQLRAPQYKNVFQLGIEPPTIYGTEHLFGDWGGEVLLIAQDFAPAQEVERLVSKGLSAASVYRHNDGDGRYDTGFRTNTRLLKFLNRDRSHLDGKRASTSGILYGNACFFLKHGEKSDTLKDFQPGREVYDGSIKVLKYVVENMKNVKAVVCLGSAAHNMMLASTIAKTLPVFHTPHPSRGSDEMHNLAWNKVREATNLSCIS